MAEERIVTTEPREDYPTATHTTIVHETAPPRSGGSGWLIGIVLLIAVIAGIFLFSRYSTSEAAKDSAVAEAAGEVGAAASQVGDAAQDAANSLAR